MATTVAEGGEREINAVATKMEERVEAQVSGSTARVRVRYDAHLPALSLRDVKKLRDILSGTVIPTVQGHVICKNWNLCGLC